MYSYFFVGIVLMVLSLISCCRGVVNMITKETFDIGLVQFLVGFFVQSYVAGTI